MLIYYKGDVSVNILKKIVRKIFYREKSSSDSYVRYLRKIGCRIGENTIFFVPDKTSIDITRPYLIEIGDNVKITQGVTLLTHGYDWSVLSFVFNELIGSAGKVKIGNNVFIGFNSTILKGVTIGNNVIIGANSLVNKDVEDNVVVAGNPAKVIMTIGEYYNKRKSQYIDEAKECAREIYKVTGKLPRVEDFREFFPLFLKRDREEIKKYNFSFKFDHDDGTLLERKFLDSKAVYNSFDEFIKDCRLDENN